MSHDFDAEFDASFDLDLDHQLRAFFRQADRPAPPASLDLGPERRIFGRANRAAHSWPVQAALAAVSVLVAVALTGGVLLVRSVVVAPGAGPASSPILLTPVSQDPHIDAMGRIDANTGWVEISRLEPSDTGFGETYLRWTHDGGKTWSDPRTVPIRVAAVEGTVVGGSTFGFQIVDATHGWTGVYAVASTASGQVRATTVWRTLDAGVTWQPLTVPLDSSASFDFHFRDALHGELFTSTEPSPASSGAAASPSPAVTCQRLSTSDGGVSWSEPQSMPCVAYITWMDSLFGYSYDDKSLQLAVTVDGGQTWATGKLPFDVQPNEWAFPLIVDHRSDGSLRSLALWVNGRGGDYAIVESRDGGRTWTRVGTVTWDASIESRVGPPVAATLTARDDDHWLSDPVRGTEDKPWFASDDGGLTWTAFNYTGLTEDVEHFLWLNANDGWASTQTTNVVASLWHTTDGGASWTKILDTP